MRRPRAANLLGIYPADMRSSPAAHSTYPPPPWTSAAHKSVAALQAASCDKTSMPIWPPPCVMRRRSGLPLTFRGLRRNSLRPCKNSCSFQLRSALQGSLRQVDCRGRRGHGRGGDFSFLMWFVRSTLPAARMLRFLRPLAFSGHGCWHLEAYRIRSAGDRIGRCSHLGKWAKCRSITGRTSSSASRRRRHEHHRGLAACAHAS